MEKTVSKADRRIFETGTTELNPPARTLHAGDVSVVIDAGALRRLAFGPVELVRQIDFPVRDRNWATLTPNVTGETLDEHPDGFRYRRCFEVDDGVLSCTVTYEVNGNGTVTATGEATAARDFTTNRTGFTLLHPIAGIAGKQVEVITSNGRVQTSIMPETISPAQPIKEIAGLSFSIDGVSLDIAFSGDVFEMEDQRNWTDASFKTYSRPLVEPFAYNIKAGTTIRQQIRLRISGQPVPGASAAPKSVRTGAPLGEALPEILLAADPDWLPDHPETDLLAASGLTALLLRTTPKAAAADLLRAAKLVQSTSGSLDLEVVLDDALPARSQMDLVAAACREAQCMPRHVTALPAAYLKSYQPSGQWPDGLSPQDAFVAASAVFPKARCGSGMLTNFTEFNRCRPDGIASGYITHGNSAIVHAADDTSVAQTIETLPDIFSSARKIGAGRGYRLGLTAIGMRSNPYGQEVSENPEQTRLTMATWDPRARALFGAAWAVSALAKTEDFGIQAIALAAPVGPFGILATETPVPRPWFDDHPEATVYPIFHALRFVAGGGQRLKVNGVPPDLAALAFSGSTGTRMVIANLSGQPREIRLAEPASAAVLDAHNFVAAVTNPDWVETALAPLPAAPMTLASPAVMLVETGTIATPESEHIHVRPDTY
ncbi:MAG: hypothetical protein RIC18_05685 [Hoeflea sp.]|uniref:hypothetical protein n=1 Tax=Hoeflea sp. TaxID=1940281 RepID=UPI0032EF7DA3